MAYTNRHTVRHKRKTIDLRSLSRQELENLKQQVNIDLVDIENQIAWAKSKLETDGIQYNYDWMDKAIVASQIKQQDIGKLNIYIEQSSYSVIQEEADLLKLLTTVREYMDGRLAPIVLDELLEKLEKQYER